MYIMDNYFHECPPMMEDQGRPIADFLSSVRRDEYIKYINNIYRDDEYRLFLQQNGQEIQNREWAYHRMNNSCWVNECVHQGPTRSSAEQFMIERAAFDSIFDSSKNTPQVQKSKVCKRYDDYRLNY